MSNVVPVNKTQAEKLELVLIEGDLSQLTPDERVVYYNRVCTSVGLNPLTRPLEYIRLNGKLVLYARRDATDQLRKIHNVSVKIVARELVGDVYVVTAQAKYPDGREDESIGAVNVKGLNGDDLANAFMKSETKSKRRVTLSICGLGILDETEVATIAQPNAKMSDAEVKQIAQGQSPDPKHDPEAYEDCASEEMPGPEDDTYTVPFGKHKGKALRDVDGLDNYVNWICDKAANEGKQLQGQVKEFVDRATEFLNL
jgi:hypothetical protein